MKATGKQDRRGLLNLVLAVAFKSGIFQHLSVLLLKHQDFSIICFPSSARRVARRTTQICQR